MVASFAHRAGLWWFALADVPDDAWSRWTTLRGDEERTPAARFVFERDRHQFIAAHALSGPLQQLADRPVGAWRFASVALRQRGASPAGRLASRHCKRTIA
ncbi:hypothetical protein [Reyranella sp.]|uniref:hypothetical protein n=1 Tax=Reyranella sp. TaxID=1929291 RepID=UPI003D111AB3